VETTTFEPDVAARATVSEARARIASLLGADPTELALIAEGEAVATIVAAHDAEPALIEAVVLKPALAGSALDAATAAAAFPPDAIRLAAELERLGAFDAPIPAPASPGRPGSLSQAQAETLRRMLLAVVTDPRLVLAKLAEQLYRLRQAKGAGEPQRAKLALQTQTLYAPLANRLGLGVLKWELEDYAFRYSEPEQYRRIASSLNERRADRERYVSDVRHMLRDELAKAGITATVEGRAKHIYSIWRKMQVKQLAFEQVFDLRAVRVLVGTVADCYAALGVVHGLWDYVPGEFDDYIATPKPNGYRSIHTAVAGPGGRTLEIQIRTKEMHAAAELGQAAHWSYKEGAKRDRAYADKLERLRQILQPRTSESADFLDRISPDLFRDQVYVFSPKGDVVALPRGATPLDFAYQVHTELGHRCRGAKVNGRMVPLNQPLANGEAVEIVTGKVAAPSRDWLIESLGFLATRSARAKVRAWFRRQDEDQHRATGRETVERELARAKIQTAESLPRLLAEFKAERAEDLYRRIGEGDVSVSQIEGAIERLKARSSEARTTRPAARGAARGIEAMGIGELLSSYARCCRPVPPEPIAGYVTVGRGVTIHRRDCANFRRLGERQPDRVLAVSWGGAPEQLYPVEFIVQAMDRRGLVRDVSGILADAKLSIDHMTTVTNSAENTADMTVEVRVHGLDELERVLARVQQLPDVVSARRR
jgi:GTP pyrophosphokinase